MTNEVGNALLKQIANAVISEYKHAKVQDEALDYVRDAVADAKIYNFSDVYMKMNTDIEKQVNSVMSVKVNDGAEKIKAMLGVDTIRVDDLTVSIKGRLPDFTLVTYFPTSTIDTVVKGNFFLTSLSVPLGEDRNVIFQRSFAVNKNLTTKTGIITLKAEYVNGRTIVKLAGEDGARYDSSSEQDKGFIRNVFVGCVAMVRVMIETFEALHNQNNNDWKCFSDETNYPKTNMYLTKSDNQVIKVADKPVYLVLRDNDCINKNINRYRRKNGTIQYAFSWIVRGHWRTLHNPETMGYGMVGERVQGKTYIKSYLKGDKNAPLIQRTYEVLDRRTKRA